MTYLCFIDSEIMSVPHMELLSADELEEAKRQAAAILEDHASGYVARVFKNDKHVATLHRDDRFRDQSQSSPSGHESNLSPA